MYERLTLAAATGLPFLLLAFHVLMGSIGVISGTIAIAARKGGAAHRRSGTVFVYAMVAMGISAVAVSVFEGKQDVVTGALAAYLVFTAWTTVRPLPQAQSAVAFPLMLLALVGGVGMLNQGVTALGMPRMSIGGVPAGMFFFLGTVFLLAVIGDIRVMRTGALQGTRRLSRHLWRMCFGLFIAMGSFVAQLSRMTWMPAWSRGVPAILFLSMAPLVVLVYWMWRIRLKQNLRGLMTTKPIGVSPGSTAAL